MRDPKKLINIFLFTGLISILGGCYLHDYSISNIFIILGLIVSAIGVISHFTYSPKKKRPYHSTFLEEFEDY
jgi:hypothetical protein